MVEEDVIMVKNQGTRSHAEWIWNTEVPTLPLFFLAFIEFWVGCQGGMHHYALVRWRRMDTHQKMLLMR